MSKKDENCLNEFAHSLVHIQKQQAISKGLTNISKNIPKSSEVLRKMFLLHVSQEFYLVKVICRNLYALFSHVRKAYTANQNGVQLFSHAEV